jgi:hypothetical protein
MKCRICARECPPGAKICRDCAAARKRAFAATVTQPLLAAAGAPSIGQPRFAPRPLRRRRANRAAPSARSEASIAASTTSRDATPSHLSVKWLFLGVAIATTIVFAVIKILASGSQQAIEVAEEETVVTASPARVDSASPNLSPGDARDAPAVVAPNAVARDAIPADRNIDAVDGLKSPALKAGARKAAGKVEAPKATPIEPPPAPKAAPVIAAPRTPAPRVIEAPREPWQAMNEALARCAREDFFNRIACEQRVRQQYCANYWGVVPQCAIGRSTDRGQ